MSSLVRTTALAALVPLLATPLARADAQSQSGTPAPTPAAPAAATTPAPPPAVVAGIPVNYDEAKVGTYTLPDPLVTSSGARVKDAATWTRVRRPEIYRMIESTQFGRAPDKPDKVVVDRFDAGTPALDGKAIRRQTTLYFTADRKGPKAEVLSYVPADAKGPVPLLLQISFSSQLERRGRFGNPSGRDVGTRSQARAGAGDWRVRARGRLPFLAKGIGFATVYYGDIEPDFNGGIPFGIRGQYLKPGETRFAADEWGAIAAWAWGLRRVMDYLETEPAIDAKRVALLGASRLGKTVLWTGATDPRFAVILASVSGEGARRSAGATTVRRSGTSPTRRATPISSRATISRTATGWISSRSTDTC